MKISVHPSEKAAAREIARQFAARIAAKPDIVLGLATGRTPVPLYRELVSLFKAGAIDFSRVRTFNLDEFYGIGPDHPGSYRLFMQQHLFGHVNVRPEHVNFLDGLARNAEGECARYERAIEAAGGIDLQLLGIGTNGHIGFNEPGRELHARTHRAALHASTRRSNRALFESEEAVPHHALSMGMATILGAREIVLLAMGKSKAKCINSVVNGPLTPRVPASFLQLHARVELVLDAGAASSLSS